MVLDLLLIGLGITLEPFPLTAFILVLSAEKGIWKGLAFLLGWQRTKAGLDGRTRDFYVRQLRDWKFSIEIALLRPEGLQMYGALCGWTLARAHARSGDRIAIASYLGGSDVFDRAIAGFASAYADQNERDHQALVDAVKAGRITAEQGL